MRMRNRPMNPTSSICWIVKLGVYGCENMKVFLNVVYTCYFLLVDKIVSWTMDPSFFLISQKY